MSVFGYRKISNKERSDDIEKIEKKDIATIITEGKKCVPVAIMHDGNEYYLANCAEDYKRGFEKFEPQFVPADRAVVVNVDHISHYEKDYNRIHFINNAIPFIPVAYKYIKGLCEKLNMKNIEK